MATPPHIERAANQAALRVKQMLVDMLMAQELGSVTIEVSPAGLQPVQRIEHRPPRIRVSQGQHTPIVRGP